MSKIILWIIKLFFIFVVLLLMVVADAWSVHPMVRILVASGMFVAILLYKPKNHTGTKLDKR